MTSEGKKCIDEMYVKIPKECTLNPHRGALLCESELERIWSEEDVKCVLGYSSKLDEDTVFIKNNLLRTLSTLILIKVPDLEPVFDILCPRTSHYQRSCQFPFNKKLLRDRLEVHHSDLFYEKQYIFCPIVIEKQQKAEVVYKDLMHRFPFMEAESTMVSSGGYGNVCRNKIAPQCYRDTTSPELPMYNSIVLHFLILLFSIP